MNFEPWNISTLSKWRNTNSYIFKVFFYYPVEALHLLRPSTWEAHFSSIMNGQNCCPRKVRELSYKPQVSLINHNKTFRMDKSKSKHVVTKIAVVIYIIDHIFFSSKIQNSCPWPTLLIPRELGGIALYRDMLITSKERERCNAQTLSLSISKHFNYSAYRIPCKAVIIKKICVKLCDARDLLNFFRISCSCWWQENHTRHII